MPRPSTDCDLRLIAAGIKIARKEGLSGLSIRKACREAGVNPGMFHYHFRSKKEFEERLLKEIYADFLKRFRFTIESAAGPRERLKTALITLAHMARENRGILTVVVKDIIAGRQDTLRFAKANFTEHIGIVLSLVRECRASGVLRGISLPNTLMMLIPPVMAPVLGIGIVEKNAAGPFLPIALAAARKMLLSDSAIEERVELAINALAPEKKP